MICRYSHVRERRHTRAAGMLPFHVAGAAFVASHPCSETGFSGRWLGVRIFVRLKDA